MHESYQSKTERLEKEVEILTTRLNELQTGIVAAFRQMGFSFKLLTGPVSRIDPYDTKQEVKSDR